MDIEDETEVIMALIGVVDLPGDQRRKLRIEFKNNGRELYWIDGNLVQEISAVGEGKAHNRAIPVSGCSVELRYSFEGRKSFADVYVDGSLYKRDVFSIEKAMSENPSKIFLLLKVLFFLGLFFLFSMGAKIGCQS